MSDTPYLPPDDLRIQAARDIVHSPKLQFVMSSGIDEIMQKSGYSGKDISSPLRHALKEAQGSASTRAFGLAFTENPAPSDNYLGLYKSKRRLLPDEVLKQIRVTDHLVAAILRARGSMLSLFGHLRKDRFDVGIELVIKPDFLKIFNPEQYEKVVERIKRFENIILNCGHTKNLEHKNQLTLAEYLDIQIRNGLTFGRFATEILYDRSVPRDVDGNFPFNRFRPIDVGTIYKAVRKGESAGDNLRVTALAMLQSITGEKINVDLEKLRGDVYSWLQIIDGTPRNAFTDREMLVFDVFPSTDLEHNGYPVSPIDTVVSSVTTHISIDTYKKLYFQNGRASKGMLVIKSNDVDSNTLDGIKMQFNASINSVSNSFRTPIFGMGTDDTMDWVPFSGEGARDDDFEYMYDQVARNILSAFSVSPDELPGYGHLSKGTNSQTLSESNNEFKLTAARDTGLRPLILKLQTFFNQRLFPMMDPLLAKVCEIQFSGLDAQSVEQEATRLQQNSALHMTYDELLTEVDKEVVGAAFGGAVPFNERFQLLADKYMSIGEVRSKFMMDPGALFDTMQKYKRDPFYLQYLQLLAQLNPAAAKAYFAPNPMAYDLMRMNVKDFLEEQD